MCVMCLKYRIQLLIIIIISLGQILLSYISNTSHILYWSFDYKRMGYIIIPKSGKREGVLDSSYKISGGKVYSEIQVQIFPP